MDTKLITETLKKLKENSPKRNFKQSIDLIINLKDIDLKKTDQQINTSITLHYDNGKKVSVCAFVGPELEKNAKETFDETISLNQFDKYKDKKEIKALANKHDFFVAQASVMAKVATAFGRVLGPRGKMPNPKTGGVLPPNANVSQVYEKFKKTVNAATKNEPTIKCMVGKEDSNEEHVVDNILTVYNTILSLVPNEKNNIKNVMLKLTMSPAFAIGEKKETEEGPVKESKSDKKTKQKETKSKENKEDKKETSKKDTPKEQPKEEVKKESKPAKENKESEKKEN